MAFFWMKTDAEFIATVDEYYAVNEGLTSVHGDLIWGPLDYPGNNTFNLSYNAFTDTRLSSLDFRKTTSDVLGGDYEPYVQHLDLSHNQIADASLEFFDLVSGPWHLISLDMSY